MNKFGSARPRITGAVVAALLTLTACDDGGEDRARVVERAAVLSPKNPRLTQIYQRSCKTCHAKPDAGAPLTGDGEAWAQRMEKGLPVLLKSTIDGFQGMPPLGLCSDCTADDLSNLIRFMASKHADGKQ